MAKIAIKLSVIFLWVTGFVLVIGDDSIGEVFDLSWPYDTHTIALPNVKRFAYTRKHVGPGSLGVWHSAYEFCMGEHVGTHIGAPYHFNKNGLTIEKIPLHKLIVAGVLIDVRKEVSQFGDNARLQIKHLEEWENENGDFPANCVLLIKFGWSQYYSNPKMYLRGKEGKGIAFPVEAAKWIVGKSQIVGIGVDTASVNPSDVDVHQIFAKKQIYVLENVNILDKLPVKNFTLMILPMKLSGGTGAPTRIVATLPPVTLTGLPETAIVPLYGHVLVIFLIALNVILEITL